MWQNKPQILWTGVRLDKQMKNTEDIHISHLEFLRHSHVHNRELLLESKTFLYVIKTLFKLYFKKICSYKKKKMVQSWYILLSVCTSKPKVWRSITLKLLAQETYWAKHPIHFNELCTLHKLQAANCFTSLENTHLGKVKCRSKITNELFSISHFLTSWRGLSFSVEKLTTWKKYPIVSQTLWSFGE